MPVVHAAPVFKRREGQNTRDVAEDCVCSSRREERTMTTIVKKDENAHQEACRHDSERQRNPIGKLPLDCKNHQRPQQEVRSQRIEHLPTCFPHIRFSVLGGNPVPGGFGGFRLICVGELFSSRVQSYIVHHSKTVALLNCFGDRNAAPLEQFATDRSSVAFRGWGLRRARSGFM